MSLMIMPLPPRSDGAARSLQAPGETSTQADERSSSSGAAAIGQALAGGRSRRSFPSLSQAAISLTPYHLIIPGPSFPLYLLDSKLTAGSVSDGPLRKPVTSTIALVSYDGELATRSVAATPIACATPATDRRLRTRMSVSRPCAPSLTAWESAGLAPARRAWAAPWLSARPFRISRRILEGWRGFRRWVTMGAEPVGDLGRVKLLILGGRFLAISEFPEGRIKARPLRRSWGMAPSSAALVWHTLESMDDIEALLPESSKPTVPDPASS
ncbi:MAG: hypothetical protein R3B07_02590 [Polyangiaceae bacterium]